MRSEFDMANVVANLSRRELARRAAAVILTQLPAVRAVARAPAKNPGVDPEIAAALDRFPTVDFDTAMVARFRQIPQSEPLPPPAAAVLDVVIPGVGAIAPVSATIIRPTGLAARAPALIHFHGGGFLFGHHRGDLPGLQTLADRSRCVIISVGYRLAPEHRFPAALDDALTAYRWLIASASSLGIDPTNIVVGGESAGGGIAAMLAIAARDTGLPRPRAQLLVYPMLDDRTGTAAALPGGNPVWTAASNIFAWTAFLGTSAGSARIPEGSVPSRTKSLRSLPPTFIGVGDLDLFLAENMIFARRLRRSGVGVHFVRVPGACHGFDLIAPTARASRDFKSAVVEFLLHATARSHG